MASQALQADPLTLLAQNITTICQDVPGVKRAPPADIEHLNRKKGKNTDSEVQQPQPATPQHDPQSSAE